MKKKSTKTKARAQANTTPDINYDGLVMRPFPYTVAGYEYAVELAQSIAGLGDENEPNNVATALLIAGIAAIEGAGERHWIADGAITQIMAKCPSVREKMNRLLAAHHGEFILCTH
jgi:hypothetical protein